jgi:hypothetical protein
MSTEATMKSKKHRAKKQERPKQQGNLGQKEAQQEQSTRSELAQMGERSKSVKPGKAKQQA